MKSLISINILNRRVANETKLLKKVKKQWKDVKIKLDIGKQYKVLRTKYASKIRRYIWTLTL